MKFHKVDREYFEKRKVFSEKYGSRELWSVIDHWPLYAGMANIGRSLAISDLFRSVLKVPGHIVEFGSWRGSNLIWMAKLLELFGPYSRKEIHCFDSFEGLTEFHKKDGDKVVEESSGGYKGSEEELFDVIDLYGLNDLIYVHKGYVEDTLEPFLMERPEFTCSFVYCDVDLYQATMNILEGLHDRMLKGGVFVLDEWNHEKFPGETVAVQEFLSKYGDSYEAEHVLYVRQPTLVLRKIKN